MGPYYIDDSDDPDAPNYKHTARDEKRRAKAYAAFMRKTDALKAIGYYDDDIVSFCDDDIASFCDDDIVSPDQAAGKTQKQENVLERQICQSPPYQATQLVVQTPSALPRDEASSENREDSVAADCGDFAEDKDAALLMSTYPFASDSDSGDSDSDSGDSFLKPSDLVGFAEADRIVVERLQEMRARGNAKSTPPGADSPPERTTPERILLGPLFVRDKRPARVFPKKNQDAPPRRQTVAATASRAKKHKAAEKPTFSLASWPLDVVILGGNYNPYGLKFPVVDNNEGFCKCEDVCTATRCSNGDAAIYCTVDCCPFMARCGNGLMPNVDLQLVMNDKTRQYAVTAVVPIEAGVIVGEYFGKLIVEESHGCVPEVNTGYRMQLKAIPTQAPRSRATIDATDHGSLMRFVNHSCDPVARFQELANGDKRTVVVLTIKPLSIGEELTVDYGPNLWFICRCGLPICCHRDIQHRKDPDFVLGRRPRRL